MTSKTTFMRAEEVITYLVSMQVAYHTKSFFQNAVRYKFKDNVYYEREEVEKFANRNSPAALEKLVKIAAAKAAEKAATKAAALEQQALDLETATKANKIMRTKSCTSSTMYLSLEGKLEVKPKPKSESERLYLFLLFVFALLFGLGFIVTGTGYYTLGGTALVVLSIYLLHLITKIGPTPDSTTPNSPPSH